MSKYRHSGLPAPASKDASDELPSWAVGVCGVAAVASLLFAVLLLLNR